VNFAYLIGGYSTVFGRHPDRSHKDLVREAYEGALRDAGLADGNAFDAAYFGNATMYVDHQPNVAGQICMTGLVRDGRFPERVPVYNVENACATSTTALAGAAREIRAGDANLAVVIGVEKLIDPTSGKGRFGIFDGALDQLDPQEWIDYYSAAGKELGKPFETGPGRSPFMDVYAMQAVWHMQTYGTTQRQIAIAAAKTHGFGADNPRAQYRFRMTSDEVLADRAVTYPFTRAMCAPMGDGAAAMVVCSQAYFDALPEAIRERAIRIKAMAFTSGKYRNFAEAGLTSVAAAKAYAQAELKPADIDVAEVHDASSFSEIYQSEMLGFCEVGKGGPFIEEGHTQLGGKVPMNTSGGLISKGHPIAASGASMLVELMEQLRGEAGPRQVHNARLGLAENGGGSIGFDEAVAAVTILERAAA
jgi:acetyl-CoA acetyltransferase